MTHLGTPGVTPLSFFRADSLSAIQAYRSGNIPWALRQRWLAAIRPYEVIAYEQVYREVNFSSDVMAKRGCLLGVGTRQCYWRLK